MKVIKESYEVSEELAKRLNSILADEFLASEAYRLAIIAMKGKKQRHLTEIAKKNGEDELEDHFKNLSEWMQSKGIKVVTDTDEMKEITNGSILKFPDGMSTKEVIDQLILSEEEAIAVYEDTIPRTELDLNVMLCGFLHDERQHLKELVDCRDEMGGGEKTEKKHNIFERGRVMKESDDVEWIPVKVYDIEWDTDGEEAGLPTNLEIDVPTYVFQDEPAALEDWISDALSDEYGFCHYGFRLEEEDPVKKDFLHVPDGESEET